ncbi:MAG: tetratricopeptide repeat protein [Nevskiaceae bacterium]|nr:MAG: tetratricopeptide repeat protein [Nevskiaceae bacterium]
MTSIKRLPLALSLVLAACTPAVIKNAAPPIQDIERKAPDDKVLPIIPSQPIAADPQKALDNYRKLLELSPDPETKAESMRRLADLQVQIEDAKGNDDAGSGKTLQESIKLYNDLLYAHPEDKHNDRIFYQMARAQQNSGEVDAAIDTLQRLTQRHPDSNLAGDAHFRRAELLFSRRRYAEAEPEYKTVMDLGDKTPFFENAQYKYGWSRYKQQNYDGALDVFIALLDRDLPQGEFYGTEDALKGVAKARSDMVRDSLRVISLSLTAEGGGKAANDYLAKKGDPRFFPLIYTALGESLLDKQRYSDAADAYAAFIERHPTHVRAPDFQERVINAYADGGFNDLVVREKERYASTYDPAAPYWAGKSPTPEVLTALRKHMGDLAKYYQARGQQDKDKNKDDFLTAAKWYRRTMEVFPKDPEITDLNFMLGDALLDGGKTLEAAQEYSKTAYDYPLHPKAADAGYAAVLAYEKVAKDVPAEQRPAALRQAIDAGVKFADKFPGHPELMPVITRMAEDLYELKAYDEAIKVASRVLKSPRAVAYQLRRSAWGVTADSQFALQHYPEAETAYTEELKLTAKDSASRPEIIEQIAASVYKQGEAARSAGNLRAAAQQFLRVAQAAPGSKIVPTAQYDGAAALIQLEDWPAAEQVLESFRTSYPAHAMLADVDKKLAVAYQKDNKPLQSAQAYQRIAARLSETPDTRREAAWLAATLYDQAKAPQTAQAYEDYVNNFPRPLARAMEARARLVDFSRERGDIGKQTYWLRQIVAADDNAGAERTDKTHLQAARAALDLARFAAADARQLRLTLPLDRSVARKKAAMQTAIDAVNKAASYGYGEVTTAATYELGALYQDFGKAMLDSDRPAKLSALELEQYNLLLEEQAEPFEEKAIDTYETNLKRIRQNVYDDWVAKSYAELLKLAPAKYGKTEKGETIYETLQ